MSVGMVFCENEPLLIAMLINRKEIYKGRIVQLIVDTVRIKGKDYIREVVKHPGGVVVMAQLESDQILFVRQSRYPMDKVLLELPAGKLDAGEEPEVCAARELEEETGYRPKSLEHIFSYYPTPGFCDELLHLYFVSQVTPAVLKLEPDEDISVEPYYLEEAFEMIRNGKIVDGKTLMALFWFDWRKGN